ncbi:MAG: hypothetical protein AB7I37_15685 [Pirellulales bacterium]
MGTSYRFRCDRCGYQALVSGGDDASMRCYTTTIECLGCQALYDVPTSDTPHRNPKQSPAKYALACPKNDQHACRKWSKQHPCPKCQKDMERGAIEVM